MATSTNALLKSAVQQNPLTRSQGMLEKLFTLWFNGFVYNQIWEDPRVDVEALELTPDSRVLTISSGGCNVLSYITEQPCQVVAVDLNRFHMYLLRLKLCALQQLPSYDDFFNFFALANSPRNIENYSRYIRDHLDDATRQFWEGGSLWRTLLNQRRINYFKKNLYNYGRSGYYIRFLHSVSKIAKGDPTRLLEAKSKEEQEELYMRWLDPAFDHWIVKTLGRLPMTVYSLGIPPQQFRYLKEDGPSGIIDLFRERVKRLACEFPIEDNYFAWQAFGRRYNHNKPEALPPYLQPQHYENLKKNVKNVETHITSTTDYLRQQPDNSMDRFVFLDSQDWMTPAQLEDLWSQVRRVGKPGTRVIFRTAGTESPIETDLNPEVRKDFIYEEELSKTYYDKDRSAVYGGFHLYRMS